MKIKNLTLSIFLQINFLILLSSCNAQNSLQTAEDNLNNQDSAILFGDKVSELANDIMYIFQSQNNTYWFGSGTEGAYSYDGKTMIHFTTNHGLCNNQIRGIQEDKLGNIYFTTVEGISKFNPSVGEQKFTTLPIAKRDSAKYNWGLEPDDLWFNQLLGKSGPYRYDGDSVYLLEFPKHQLEDEFYSKFPKSANSPYDVYSIYKDSKGNVWFGTAVLGACRYNGKNFDWISEKDVTEIHDGPSNGVRSIIEDKDGKFWFSNSLYRYDVYQSNSSHPASCYVREESIGCLDGKEAGVICEYLSAVKDDNGNIWIVTYLNGIWKYNPNETNESALTHYIIKDNGKIAKLFSIYKDHQGQLWLGSHETGVYKFNGVSFEKFQL